MKAPCGLLLIFFAMTALAQEPGLPVSYIDRMVRAYDSSLPARLVKQITDTAQTDRQKVSAIFRWITDNISYNVQRYGRSRSPFVFEEPDDNDSSALKPLNLRVAETVLRRRMGVCDGYARLFKTLCDFAGIPSETITGFGRTNWGRRTRFGSNHSWNAVYLDSNWYLLDVTWAAGYTNSRGDEFFRRFDERYFLTSPSQFILDHYPDDVRWTLLTDPPGQTEFNRTPFHYMGFTKTGIQSFTPSKGAIEAAVGDSIYFEVTSLNAQGILEVVSGVQPKDTIPNDDVPIVYGGRRKSFTYHVTEESGPWLYVICNGYVILRYKLNIRKPDDRTAGSGR